MAVETLILISNPGSASRKYALYDGSTCRAQLHFEYEASAVICTITAGEHRRRVPVQLSHIDDAAEQVVGILQKSEMLKADEHIARVGLRIVAPGSFFLKDHVVTNELEAQLHALEPRAPLHIAATLKELQSLRRHFATTVIVGVSDSAFHASKPDVAWNYGIPLHDADAFDIKRFGYHGLSAAAAVATLRQLHQLQPKVVLCHLGSGASVTALLHGRSVDTTMGYSPLEGLIMATRVGSIDITAARVLKAMLHTDDDGLDIYLNTKGGLQGLSGVSSDIRELVAVESTNHHAQLALQTYVYAIQKAIGQMTAVLGGIDQLVFTGTVGERSVPVRERVLRAFGYLGFSLDSTINTACTAPTEPVNMAASGAKPIWVVPTNESAQIARHAARAT